MSFDLPFIQFLGHLCDSACNNIYYMYLWIKKIQLKIEIYLYTQTDMRKIDVPLDG